MTASGGEEALKHLPKPILSKLRALVQRVRHVQLIRGGFATVAALTIAVIIIMAISATFTILSPMVHAALTTAGLLAVLATAYRTLFVPLRTHLSLSEIARVLETRHPELQERLSTAIGLLGSDDPDAIRGSEELLEQVVKAAITDAKTMRPEREFTNRSARSYIKMAGGAAALIALAALVFPGSSTRLLTRVVAPFSKVGNAFAHHLVVEPGDLRVPIGDPVTIRVTVLDPDARRAEIRRSSAGTPESVEAMALLSRDPEAGTTDFAITFPSVGEDFRYRIRSGRALSAYHEVSAATRPSVKRLEVIYHYPEYTRLGQSTVNDPQQEISAVSGTKIQVVANFDRPLDRAVFQIDGNLIPATQDRSDDEQNPHATWNFDITDEMEGYWKIALTDTFGVPNQAIENPIRSIPDRAPKLRLVSGQSNLRLRPDERLTLRYEVDEDFGIASTTILISDPQQAIPQAVPKLEAPEIYTGKATLDIGELTTGPDKTFEFFLEVADTHPDAQSAKVGPISVTIDAGADSLAEQFVDEQRSTMQQALTEAIAKLQEAKTHTTPIATELVKPDIIPLEILQELAKIQTLTGEAEKLVRDTAVAAAAPSSLFKMLSPALVGTAEDHLVPARQAAEEIPLTDEKVTRVHRAHKVSSEIDEGIADLNVAIRELKQQTAHAKLIARMSDLGEKQQQLAEDLAASTDADAQEKLREEQEQLAEEMNELVEASEKTVADQLLDARQDATELAEAAGELAEKQAELADLLDQAETPEAREEAVNDLIRTLEAEQREIGNQAGAMQDVARREAPDPTLLDELDASQDNAYAAADFLLENKLTESAATGAANAQTLKLLQGSVDHPALHEQLAYLATWQETVARQIDALARQRLDEALADRQEFLAEEAVQLAQDADDFRKDAEALADPSALQQVQQASNQATMAAQSARQASSQLGGQTSTGAFEFARSPSKIPSHMNRSPNAPPRPTQAGVSQPGSLTQFNQGEAPAGDDELPDMSAIEGSRENPFSVGQVAIDTLPPALEDGSMNISGGRLPPGGTPPATIAATPNAAPGSASGQKSIASAAQQPAMQAQHGLSGAASALSNAAGSLGQQANSPSAQAQPQISQQMLEAARQAAEVAMEEDPELAAQIAQKIAENLTQPTPEIERPAVKDWQNIRGKVRSGLASTAKNRTPEEYRDLVKNYFREIARRSNEEQR